MKVLWWVLGIWFITAFMLTVINPLPAASLVERMLIIAGPIALLVLFISFFSGFQRVMRQIPGRTLIMLHIIRLPAGGVFIVLAEQGLLPYDFAWPAGIGDIIVGTVALAIVVISRKTAIHPAVLASFNVIGLLDFINVQRVVAGLTGAGRNAEFVAMQGPPLALVPYFVVPLLYFTHLYMLARLARHDRSLFLQPATRVE